MTTRCEQIGDATLYLGDCREILPRVGKVAAVITDQPYGTGWVNGGGKKAGDFEATFQRPEWDTFDASWVPLTTADTIAAFCPQAALGEMISALGGRVHLRAYVKSNPRPAIGRSDTPSLEPVLIAPKVRFGGPQHFVAYNGDNTFHPTQKPVEVMCWLVEGCSAPGETVMDPFMGSGSTGVACVRLGRRFVGIEINPEFFEASVRRIEEAWKQPRLFKEPAPTPTQGAFGL